VLFVHVRKENNMPYKREGRIIYHKKNGKWTIKQKCGSVANDQAALRILEGLESKE
jgi:hypothetical protein